MNRLHMRKIEIAADRLPGEHAHPLKNQRLLKYPKLHRVSLTVRLAGRREKVPKNARSGNVVALPGVLLHH